MFRELKTRCSDACVSDLRLDAWLAQQLDDDQARELRAHLAACARCRSHEAMLRSQREEFHAAHPALPPWLALHDARAVQQPPRHQKAPCVNGHTRRTFEAAAARATSRWRRALSLASAGAAALALLALAMLTRDPVRTKGGDYVSFYVKRGEDVHRGKPRERVHSGDKLRFAYTAASARYLAILSLDGAQRASVYFPAAEHAARIAPGTDVLLPSAVELDDTPGEEHIMALFCDRALPLEQLRAALQERRAALPVPSGCARDELIVVKEAATP